MKKYRKRPVVIEAVQWFKHGDHEKVQVPKFFLNLNDVMGCIETLEGDHLVKPGDWIIKGVEGEHYPCKDSIFRATYEPVEE